MNTFDRRPLAYEAIDEDYAREQNDPQRDRFRGLFYIGECVVF